MEARPKNWHNLEMLNDEFGIEVKQDGMWLNAVEGGHPLIFKTEAERDSKIAAIRAL